MFVISTKPPTGHEGKMGEVVVQPLKLLWPIAARECVSCLAKPTNQVAGIYDYICGFLSRSWDVVAVIAEFVIVGSRHRFVFCT